MNQDTYYLRLSGRVNIPDRAETGHNYKIVVGGSVDGEYKEDNHDGSYSYIGKFIPVNLELITEKGKTIKAKDPRRNSAKIRAYLFKEYSNEGYPEAFDDIYDAFTLEVMWRTPELLRAARERILNDEK